MSNGTAQIKIIDGTQYLEINSELTYFNNSPFIQKGSYMVFSDDKLFGLVINVTNNDVVNSCFNITNHKKKTLKIREVIAKPNEMGIDINDTIRVMYLNEIDYRDFIKLMPYFENRLKYYKTYEPNTNSRVDYSEFSRAWNVLNSENPVDDIECVYIPNSFKSPKPRQTANDDILSISGTTS